MIDGFDSQEKTKLDVLTSKNAKFFFYRMNEVLQANNLPLKKVKHSVVTEDYITIEAIQSQNWPYFVESVVEACSRENSGKTIYQHQSKLIKASILMIYILKTIYQTIFLDCWCEFYFHKGRFPGSQELIMVLQA